MTTTPAPQLNLIISSPRVRRLIYATYTLLLIIAGALQVWFATIGSDQPVWLPAVVAVLAYLGIPVGGLAVVNTTASSAVRPAPPVR